MNGKNLNYDEKKDKSLVITSVSKVIEKSVTFLAQQLFS